MSWQNLPRSPAELRRYLARMLVEQEARLLSHLRLLETGSLSDDVAGGEVVSGSEARTIIATAVEIIRRRDVENPTAWARRVRKAKNKSIAADPSVASSDNFFGVGACPAPTDFAFAFDEASGTLRDEYLIVAAIKLADAYVARREEVRRMPREREKAESDNKILSEAFRRIKRGSATDGVGWFKGVFAAKAKGATVAGRRSGVTRSTCIVPTPASARTSRRRRSPAHLWRTATEDQKAAWMARSIYDAVGGLAITINLSDQILEDAMNASKGTMNHLRDRFTKLLSRRIGHKPNVLLFGEQGEGQKPHIHGVVELTNTAEHREAIRAAGEVLSGFDLLKRGRARIVDVQPLYDPEKWAGGYLSKYRATTKRVFGSERVVVYSRPLGEGGKEVAALSDLIAAPI